MGGAVRSRGTSAPAATICLVACGVLFAPIAPRAAEVKIQLPPETDSFKPGPGADIANSQCLTCHSVEYVTTK
jgi:mono/diheme cytochrome c family protein